MASVDIRAMIAKKSEAKQNGKKLVLKDINRDLIIALTALPVYGKEVRDEEILSIIINGGVQSSYYDRIKKTFNERLEKKEIKKAKNGNCVDTDGFLVLIPRC